MVSCDKIIYFVTFAVSFCGWTENRSSFSFCCTFQFIGLFSTPNWTHSHEMAESWWIYHLFRLLVYFLFYFGFYVYKSHSHTECHLKFENVFHSIWNHSRSPMLYGSDLLYDINSIIIHCAIRKSLSVCLCVCFTFISFWASECNLLHQFVVRGKSSICCECAPQSRFDKVYKTNKNRSIQAFRKWENREREGERTKWKEIDGRRVRITPYLRSSRWNSFNPTRFKRLKSIYFHVSNLPFLLSTFEVLFFFLAFRRCER